MVFESQFQGQWYSADPGKIEALWSGSGTNWEKGPYSLVILPHAGWPYSLRGQSQVLKSLEMDLYEHVLLFSPSHYYKLETNGLFWGSFTNYEGPWGSIRGLPEQKSLGLSKTFLPGNTMIQGEHGVEMLLPGLSRVLAQDGRLGTFLVGPVANPDSLKYLASQVLEYIQRLKGGRVLLLVSSDMTHYGPRFAYEPFGALPQESTKKKIQDLDRYFLDDVASGDIDGIWELHEQQDLTICGFWPILLGLQIEELLSRKPEKSSLEYYTSMDVYPGRPGDSNAVAYGALRRRSL